MKTIIKVVTLVAIIFGGLTVAKNEIKEQIEFKDLKSNIANMIENKDSMETIKENRINFAYVEGDKVVIMQDIENSNYRIELNKNHENIVDSVLMYMTGYNAFNTNIDNVQISFNSVQGINSSVEGVQVTFNNNSGMWLEN